MPDYQGMPEYPPNPGTQKKPRFETITSLGKAFADEFRPLGDRHWSPNHARQATAEFQGEMVVIHNIRNTDYRSATDYTTQFFDAVYNLSEIESMDVIEVPFAGLPSVAHLEVSFGFADGRHLGVSVEARYENGESFDTLGGFCNQFELIYVIADERDMIRLCTDINKNNVYMYRLKLTPEEVRTVFVDVLERANKLSREPEFYHSVSNNCTTNIIKHINHARAKAIPFEYRTLFSGYLDHLLYDLKLLETTAPTFEEARSASLINPLASEYGDTEFFSAGIRQNYF